MTTIVHVVPSTNRGGTEANCLQLARAFSRIGIQNVIVVLRDTSGGMGPDLEASSCRKLILLRPNASRRVTEFRSFWRVCRTHSPDAVVVHFFGVDAALLAIAGRLAGCREVVVASGNAIVPGRLGPVSRAKLWAVSLILAAARVPVAFASDWIKRSWIGNGLFSSRSRVIRNGCDVREIAREAAASCASQRSKEKFVIGMVARLDPMKDHASLLEAVARVVQGPATSNLELWIIGDGICAPILRARVAQLGLREHVRFLGVRSDVPYCLGLMDLFAFATKEEEGFGIAVIEALAAGVPVLATAVPACSEVLMNGKLGTLVSPRDTHALALAIERIIDRARQGHRQIPDRALVYERYDISRTAKAYLRLMRLLDT